ncbi:MAG TPA: methyltransferase domain-containing protein, partial [Bacilli bacterium]|nr:methyltransferase domain-containing protein [Bacilli bacterium]
KELDIINNLANSKQCYILDFGAMYGQFGKYISMYNHKVDSFDIMIDNDHHINTLNNNYDIIRSKDTLSHIQNNLYITISNLVKRLNNNGYLIIVDYFVNKYIDYNYTTKALLPFWHTQMFDINSFTKFGLKLKMEYPFSIGKHQILDMKVDKNTRYIVYEKITS